MSLINQKRKLFVQKRTHTHFPGLKESPQIIYVSLLGRFSFTGVTGGLLLLGSFGDHTLATAVSDLEAAVPVPATAGVAAEVETGLMVSTTRLWLV